MTALRALGPTEAAAALPGSGIREIMEIALRSPESIRLEIGDPNFPTPPHVAEAVRAAADRNGYSATAGTAELRRLLHDGLTARHGIDLTSHEVVVTAGAVGAISVALSAIIEPGDEVLVPDPSWPNFAMLVQTRNAIPVPYRLQESRGFIPHLEDLERLITPSTRAIILNSPSNPLGSMIPREQLRQVCALAAQHNLWVVSDETYDEIVFEGVHVATAAAAPEFAERIISVYSFSKTYSMTGFRVGYAAVPRTIATAFTRIQEASTSCVSSISQVAAVAALTGPQSCVAEMLTTYRKRRDRALAILESSDVGALVPTGAFYLWADVRATGLPSREVALALLRESGVAVAPGTAFGAGGEGWVRISLASDDDLLAEGVSRLANFVRLSSG
jgi:aspartate/methionine/tyrosine aminotransferase